MTTLALTEEMTEDEALIAATDWAAAAIEEGIKAAGYDCFTSESDMSESRYVIVLLPSEERNKPRFEIRISAHSNSRCKPDYSLRVDAKRPWSIEADAKQELPWMLAEIAEKAAAIAAEEAE